MVNFCEKQHFLYLTTWVTFWATFGKIGLLFNLTCGHYGYCPPSHLLQSVDNIFLKLFLFHFTELDPSQLSFTSKQPPKKKRKSRTAFTNHQIFELEKRFLYQKYLSPADRDEIAAQLGLTNAQVPLVLLMFKSHQTGACSVCQPI